MGQFRSVIKVSCEKDIFTAEKDFDTLEKAQAWIKDSLPQYNNIIEHYVKHGEERLDVHDRFYMDVDYSNAVKRYELANGDYIFRLQRELESMGIKTTTYETQSYYNNFKLSDIWCTHLLLLNTPVKYKNNGVGIGTYMSEDMETPYILDIWKYTGNHDFFNKDFAKVDSAAIKEMARLVAESFGYKVNAQTKYEQLDLFSILGV